MVAEEAFGILTDDDLYLDCRLVKPANLTDETLRALSVWVARYPLTMSSVITCARQEAAAYGSDGVTAHLVFDLRGTGESEGEPGDRRFNRDLEAVKAWAAERFGSITLRFLGMPLGKGRVSPLPLRPGVVMEQYLYEPESPADRPPILYLSTYSNFDRLDDARCQALARAGYTVYGLDPLRYLLHASARERLEPAVVWEDCRQLCRALPGDPVVIAQPVSAGLALFWAAGVQEIAGVVAIGQAQAGFKVSHIFDPGKQYNFFLSRHIFQIAPRPVVLVQRQGKALGGDEDELSSLYQTCGEPRRRESVPEISPAFLLEMLAWIEEKG